MWKTYGLLAACVACGLVFISLSSGKVFAQDARYVALASGFLPPSIEARGMTVDSTGHVYITGSIHEQTLSTTPASWDATLGSPDVFDGFLIKLSPAGELVWSTYFGGVEQDRAYDVEISPNGCVLVCGRFGRNLGRQFPMGQGTQSNVLQPEFAGFFDSPYGFQNAGVICFDSDGQLQWGTYVGTGSLLRDMAIAPNGDIYAVGVHQSTSPQAPMTGAPYESWFAGTHQPSPAGGDDVVLYKIASDGSDMRWATYVGGNYSDRGEPSVTVDEAGAPVVFIETNSTNLPVTPGAIQPFKSGNAATDDWWIGRYSADGTTLLAATYLGGSGDEAAGRNNIATDIDGQIVVAAITTSTDIAGVAFDAFQTSNAGGSGTIWGTFGDVFVAKLGPNFDSINATYLGGSQLDCTEALGTDDKGDVYVALRTRSPDFPVTVNAFQPQHGGGDDDGAIVRLSADLKSMKFGSFVGTSGDDWFRASAVTSDGQIYASGSTTLAADWNQISPDIVNSVFTPIGQTNTAAPTLVRAVPLPETAHPGAVTATFSDGTFGALDVVEGQAAVADERVRFSSAGHHRLALTDHDYDNPVALMQIMPDMRRRSQVGFRFRADGSEGTGTEVTIDRGFDNDFYLTVAGVSSASPSIPLVDVSPQDSIGLRVAVIGSTANIYIDGVLRHVATGVPVQSGVTSVVASLGPVAGTIELDYVMLRPHGHYPDVTIDTAGCMWVSLEDDELFPAFLDDTFFFHTETGSADIEVFLGVLAPFFDRVEAISTNHIILGTSLTVRPEYGEIGLEYRGVTESARRY